MTELLEVTHLAYKHGVPEMNIRRGRIKAGFYAKGHPSLCRAFKLAPKLVFGYAIDGSFSKELDLFVYRHR